MHVYACCVLPCPPQAAQTSGCRHWGGELGCGPHQWHGAWQQSSLHVRPGQVRTAGQVRSGNSALHVRPGQVRPDRAGQSVRSAPGQVWYVHPACQIPLHIGTACPFPLHIGT
eukprot:1137646-Pelagomonas_calceolata.AAC.4